ncbi:polyprenyl synthetase family protein [Candidatus Nomurabacteria bacterium]|mgnify:CR=1 FL=1|uniref:Polyprenyl synthetase family protein n=1 Tax=candidate division WWE3 bacterium TaxID=2053526 RepID=A0A955E237_UNCKA|nr:polyprenyl synthetase family protein [candidate division WWE3 bacterium]MCB9824021.1 polyprenyl synthetase family protein [Candidatus Nomurabacteria bacterium]MCB9827008.1 polyprenyl synthetase family protein [Candidatus Nomurabacteria bacterium]MCB9827962.1 polyprenyl synthetase family protein [Candidatus Nomurabacteria bacterium]HXK52751.1 polyprenyl synthetase family protein [bacterium]
MNKQFLQKLTAFQNSFNANFFLEIEDLEKHMMENMSHSLQEVYRRYNKLSTNGGKRIRPFLADVSYSAFGGQDTKNIRKLCIAVELTNSYILALDDDLDRTQLRRNSPTANKSIYEYLLTLRPTTEMSYAHHLTSSLISITSLMYMHYINSFIIEQTTFEESVKLRLIDTLAKMIFKTAQGENSETVLMLDRDISIKRSLDILLTKTGYYTIETPVRMGYFATGEENPSVTSSLEEYAHNVGLAFQLNDDIIGIFGDTNIAGKSNSDDIKEGKITPLVAYIYENGSSKDISVIESILGRADITDEEADRFRDVVVSSGSKDFVSNLAREYADKGKASIKNAEKFAVSKDAFNTFFELADFVIDRSF